MQDLDHLLQKALDITIAAAKAELIEQGHDASGDLIQSFEGVVKGDPRKFIGEVWANYYWLFLDEGTKPHRPPFQAIWDWSFDVQPGMPQSERKGFVWGVITNIGKEGTPTSGSYKFSKNQRRKDFTTQTIASVENDIEALLAGENGISSIIERAITMIV